MPHTIKDLKELFADRTPLSVALEINGFTGFRTTVLDDLTPNEIEQLYQIHVPTEKDMKAECNALKEELLKKTWRSNILSLAEKTGIKEKEDFSKFNNWMMLNSKFKKNLNAHSVEELKELHKQLRGVQQNNCRSAQNPMTKAWWDKSEHLKNFN